MRQVCISARPPINYKRLQSIADKVSGGCCDLKPYTCSSDVMLYWHISERNRKYGQYEWHFQNIGHSHMGVIITKININTLQIGSLLHL